MLGRGELELAAVTHAVLSREKRQMNMITIKAVKDSHWIDKNRDQILSVPRSP